MNMIPVSYTHLDVYKRQANQTVEFNDEEIIDLFKAQYVSMLLYEVKKGNVKMCIRDSLLVILWITKKNFYMIKKNG